MRAEAIQAQMISGEAIRPGGPGEGAAPSRGFPRSVARGGNGFWLHVLFAARIRPSYSPDLCGHTRRTDR